MEIENKIKMIKQSNVYRSIYSYERNKTKNADNNILKTITRYYFWIEDNFVYCKQEDNNNAFYTQFECFQDGNEEIFDENKFKKHFEKITKFLLSI